MKSGSRTGRLGRPEAVQSNPYEGLPDRAFWRTAVAGRVPGGLEDVYTPRFPISRDMGIFTAGSCFAQHVGRALSGAGYRVIDNERLPRGVPSDLAQRYGYRLYSGRFGNVYTLRQMVQLLEESLHRRRLSAPVWVRDGRFFDAQRPNVEPGGLDSAADVMAHRRTHLHRVVEALGDADLVVFTLGLTETWAHRSGTVYPTAPGVIADPPDPTDFRFVNLGFEDVMRDFRRFRSLVKSVNRKMKILLTVSPVPLTATASGAHVQVATMYSKSVLRAVCGAACAAYSDVDYFPSYELIASPSARGAFFEPNLRSVSKEGVAMAMATFMAAHGGNAPLPRKAPSAPPEGGKSADVVCEEELLEAFAAR